MSYPSVDYGSIAKGKTLARKNFMKGAALIFFVLFVQFKGESQAKQRGGGIESPNTVWILNGNTEIHLDTEVFKRIGKRKLRKQYNAEFGIGEIQYASGFSLGKNASYKFYHTDINNQVRNDQGLSTWNLIGLFADKIQDGRWAESGWKWVNGMQLYYVRVFHAIKDQELFAELIFYNLNDKLVFGLFQCPVNELPHWQNHIEVANSSLKNNSIHSARLVLNRRGD